MFQKISLLFHIDFFMFMGIDMHLVIFHECQSLPCWNVKDSFSPSDPYQQTLVSCVEIMSRSKVTFTDIYKQDKSILSYFA
jgi:hypothetical protein